MDAAAAIPSWAWAVFGVAVVVGLTLDLFAHRGDRAESQKNAAIWTAIWIAAGLGFLGFVALLLGREAAEEYLAAYLLEKSLSLDNLFLFLIIFRGLNIPERYHHRVLYWGILGAIGFRALFIFLGVAAFRNFEWVTYVFGGVLLFAAWRSWHEDPAARKENRFVRWVSKHLPVSERDHGGRFFARENGRLVATSLFVALAAIELSDVLFAIDSVAAALSVTRREFILYTANIFAILGLRSLYLLLETTILRFRYLHYGLAGVLAFAALKMLAQDLVHVPPLVSVGVIVAIIGASAGASLWKPGGAGERRERAASPR